MVDLGQGGVLPAHADHGPHIRLEVERSQDLADDLELVEGSEFFAEVLAVVPGKSNGCDAPLAETLVEFADEGGHRLLRLSHVAYVRELVEDPFSLIDDHAIDTHRSGVNAHIQLC